MNTEAPDSRRKNKSESGEASDSERLVNAEQWRCPNCGQHVFVAVEAEPPEVCHCCKDMTTWRLVAR